MSYLWLWSVAGAGVGMVNALTRWRTVSSISTEAATASLILVVGGMVLRLSAVAGLLAAGLRRGIVPGILAFGGLWITRSAVVIWLGTKGRGLYRSMPEQVRG